MKDVCYKKNDQLHFSFQATKHLPETYPPINIQMKGPSFDILESYQSFVHNLAENMGIDVECSWVTPSVSVMAKTYEPNSTIIRDSVRVETYERNVQVRLHL